MPSHNSGAQCPFCHPDIRDYAFFSNKGNLAIINIAPVLPGHSLIIPELHMASITVMRFDELCTFMETARKATLILMKAFGTDAFDWSVQEKPEAGQSIEHIHLHIVPRIKNDLDKPGDWYPMVHKNDKEIIDSLDRQKLDPGTLNKIVDRLRQVARNLGC